MPMALEEEGAAGETAGLLPVRQPGSASATAAAAAARRKPDLLLWCCRALNIVTAICELLCGVALGIAIALEGESADRGLPDRLYRFTGQAMRVFGIVIAGLLMMVETEWQWLLYLVPLLDSWLGRGIFQVFEAVLTYREAISVGGSDLHKSLQLYRSVACASLLGCAGVYILGGVLCIGAIRKARYRREEALSKAQAELDALERKRGELQRMLGRAAQD